MKLGLVRAAALAATTFSASTSRAQAHRPVDLARWLADAARLTERARRAHAQEEDDRIRAEMLRLALTIEPRLAHVCGDIDLGVVSTGWITEYALGPADRLVTIDCHLGAVLGNSEAVPYYVRLDATPSIRRLPVPEWTSGRATTEMLISGMPSFDASSRTLTVVNRCCAGTEGTTRVYRVTTTGDLSLASVVEWTIDDAGRERRRVLYPRHAAHRAR